MKLKTIRNFLKQPYMVRLSLFTLFGISFKLHIFVASDDRGDDNNPLFHNHPWGWWRTYILLGKYKECTPKGDFVRSCGYFGGGNGDTLHRVELIDNQPALTLFMTGSKHNKSWGFNCPKGIKDFKDFHENGGCSK